MQTHPEQFATSPGHRPAWFVHRSGSVPETTLSTLADVLRLLDGTADPAAEGCAVRAWRVRSGTLFLGEGAAAETLYVVRSGSFKCLKTAEDGYEQVQGFSSAGDLLGFESLALGCQSHTVVALEDSSVYGLALRELDPLRRRSPAFDRALQRALSGQLARAAATAGMMAAVPAEVRLARFLVWMSDRMAAQGRSPRRFLLRMNRRDIASLLAVAHETVSRSFGMLADWGCVRVENREVEILDMSGLKACTRSSRRDADRGGCGAANSGFMRLASQTRQRVAA